MSDELTTNNMPSNMMPLYRLYHDGARNLSNPELMSIVIGAGVSEERAMYMSNNIFKSFEFDKFGSLSVAQLSNIPNITTLKASIITAAFELVRRYECYHEDLEPIRISSPEAAYKLLYPLLRDELVEHFILLLLDTKNKLIRKVHISQGSLNANIVHPREVLKPAIIESAAAILVAHNHPSGDPAPSQNDIDITRKLSESAKMVGIDFYDHIIIGKGRFYSLKEQNLI